MSGTDTGVTCYTVKSMADSREENLKELIAPVEIERIVERLAREIERDYRGQNPLLVCALKGAVVFLADLMRALDMEFNIDFIQPSCYPTGKTPKTNVTIKKDITTNITGRDVIIVEDIIDRGKSARAVTEYLLKSAPASIKVATLLLRESADEEPYWPHYVGTRIPDGFVVGYGMDHSEMYRGLKGVYILEGL
ncbi:MAG: hypoxanthine phosphoribosyltransferase [Proteobacteria bacterium]|nr:hypoxanthine phosphoribosyltransferase [Pseudomonadota bacterium]